MIYIIHPDMELWDFMLDGVRDRNDVREFPLNRYCTFPQRVIRKLFPNRFLPASFVVGRKLRQELKKLKSGDQVIVSANYTPVLHHALRKVTDDKVVINLWMWNPVNTTSILNRSIDLLRELGVKLHTFDRSDATKYGMIYHNTFYNMNVKLEPTRTFYDFYFLGAPKNRGDKIQEVQSLLEGYKCLFITPASLADFITYKENLEHIKDSRCVIDIVQKTQHDITLRPLEALSFKKKLLTNNVNVKECAFYNPKNIFILGEDDNERLHEFLNTPFQEIESQIIKKYDINTWVDAFLSQIND